MTFKESAKTIWEAGGLFHFLKWVIPIRYYDNQWFIMYPFWYNGHFGWRSINKCKETKCRAEYVGYKQHLY